MLKSILSKQLVSPLLSVGAHLKYNSESATIQRRRRVDLIRPLVREKRFTFALSSIAATPCLALPKKNHDDVGVEKDKSLPGLISAH